MELENINPEPNPFVAQVQQAQRSSEELARREKGGSGKKKYLILLIVLILIAAGVFLIVKTLSGSSSSGAFATPTPTEQGVFRGTAENTATPEPTPEESAAPLTETDRKEVSIKVLNGTGIAKESSYMQGKLKDLGYSDISVGNDETQDNSTAIVTFAKDLNAAVVSEITKLAKSEYNKVETKEEDSPSTDVVIVTGLRPGQSLGS